MYILPQFKKKQCTIRGFFFLQKFVSVSKYLANKLFKAVSFHWGVMGMAVCGGFPYIVPSVHCGPSVAQPIHLDSTQLSKKFISDYLWGLVDTAW